MAVMLRSHEDESTIAEPDLRDLVGTIRRRLWIVLLAMIVGGAAGYLYGTTLTPEFTATAQILVLPTLTSPTRPPEPISMSTEKAVAASTEVARIARDQLGSTPGLQELQEGISIDAADGTEILQVSFTGPDKAAARANAQAIAESYLLFRSQQAEDGVRAHAAPHEEQIADVEASMNRPRRRMADYEPGSPTWQAMLDRRNALADLRQSLEDQLGPITTLSTDPGEVIDPAGIPSSPSSPRPLVFGAAGAVLGLLLGVGLAYTWPSRRTDARRRARD